MDVWKPLESIGRLFYIVSPKTTTFKDINSVPNYAEDCTPDLVFLFFLEVCISNFMKKSSLRVNDIIACLSQGIFVKIIRLLVPGGHFAVYMYIYSHWRIVDLQWQSLYTWWIGFLAVDFLYYCAHRSAHTFNFLWVTHQVHHSSEDYNISTNVRQSVLQLFIIWTLYLPLAFVLPPTMYLVHMQFSYIYQFWIHTELIRSLGPLEHILNTPSHHRVHHGANKDCIDKNFGGTLIIWDKMFGTFQPETEEIVYGVTEPVNSFNLLYIQFNYCIHIWRTFQNYKGLENKLSVVVKGPGWSPGKSWLGDSENIPNMKAPAKKYDPQVPKLIKIYLIWHFFIITQGYLQIMNIYWYLPKTTLYGSMGYVVFSLICIGMFLDNNIYSPLLEVARCLSYFIMDFCLSFSNHTLTALLAKWVSDEIVQQTFIASLIIWTIFCIVNWKATKKTSMSRDTKVADRYQTR